MYVLTSYRLLFMRRVLQHTIALSAPGTIIRGGDLQHRAHWPGGNNLAIVCTQALLIQLASGAFGKFFRVQENILWKGDLEIGQDSLQKN
jgi:hypothetical protein